MIYIENNIDLVFEKLVSSYPDLKDYFERYQRNEFGDAFEERVSYYDIAMIGSYVKKEVISGEIKDMPKFFSAVEEILNNSDSYVQELIVIGLFESLQNDRSIDYHNAFNNWLGPKSSSAWKALIEFWEGKQTGKRRGKKY